MTLFRNKYRIESTRFKGYDYSGNGAYFITVCTKNRDCLFGEIILVETGLRPVSTNIRTDDNNISEPKMILSDAGKIVSDCWFDLPNHYRNIILDEFVIMPNHIHAIIRIHNPENRNPKHGLSEFVRALKSFSSRRINEIQKKNHKKIWQSRFYDHIIWADSELNRIRLYIRNNVANWQNDIHHSDQGKKNI